MQKLKFGILEDDPRVGNSIKTNLEKTGLVEVVLLETTSKVFLDKVNTNELDAVCLDIDLDGDTMSGLDVASLVNLPVIFTTGKTKDYISGIEEINFSKSTPVEHITKPITQDKLSKILPKLINEIKANQNSNFVILDFGELKHVKIPISSVVCFETETGKSGLSGNKKIYFDNRKNETLIDVDFNDLEKAGLSKSVFIMPHRSFRVNVNKVQSYNEKTHELVVEVFKSSGKLEPKNIPVSENYRKLVRDELKRRLPLP